MASINSTSDMNMPATGDANNNESTGNASSSINTPVSAQTPAPPSASLQSGQQSSASFTPGMTTGAASTSAVPLSNVSSTLPAAVSSSLTTSSASIPNTSTANQTPSHTQAGSSGLSETGSSGIAPTATAEQEQGVFMPTVVIPPAEILPTSSHSLNSGTTGPFDLSAGALSSAGGDDTIAAFTITPGADVSSHPEDLSVLSSTQPRLSASQMFLQQQLAAQQAVMEQETTKKKAAVPENTPKGSKTTGPQALRPQKPTASVQQSAASAQSYSPGEMLGQDASLLIQHQRQNTTEPPGGFSMPTGSVDPGITSSAAAASSQGTVGSGLESSQWHHDLDQLRLDQQETSLERLMHAQERQAAETVVPAMKSSGTTFNTNNNTISGAQGIQVPPTSASGVLPSGPFAGLSSVNGTDSLSGISASNGTTSSGSTPDVIGATTTPASTITGGLGVGPFAMTLQAPALSPSALSSSPMVIPSTASSMAPLTAPTQTPPAAPTTASAASIMAPPSTGLNVGSPSVASGHNPQNQMAATADNTANSKPSGHRGGGAQVFKATYSGVPVYEMMCRGIAVMRRRSDSYLNATQILKVAEFDKPQRTRILEREVQRGEHEKVQGGYGKYQGTWVPFERGLLLCQEYMVIDLLKPLLEYQSKASSPPLAPKHITAASFKPRKVREPRPPKGSKAKLKGSGKLLTQSGGPVMGVIDGSGRDHSSHIFGGDEDDDVSTSEVDDQEAQTREGSIASRDETMSILSAQSRTPSPSGSRNSSSEVSDVEGYARGNRRQRSTERSQRARKKPSRPGDELFVGHHEGSSLRKQSGYASPGGHRSRQHGHNTDQDVEMYSRDERRPSPGRRHRGELVHDRSWQEDERSMSTGMATGSNQSHYAETLLNYFVSDATTLPPILVEPPADLDFDLIIDEEGHTPLHWAVAMAKTKIVKLLVKHGADIYRVNNQGQTALMRSVLFTNNFDLKTFPSLLEILQKTIFTIDKNDQTVFHHIAVTAGMRGKVHASRYYMECLLEKLAQHPSELASIINVQDLVGDTALIIAARIGNKKIVRLLLEAGADVKIRNKSGRNADEFMHDTALAEGHLSGPPPSTLFPPSSLPLSQQQQSSAYPQQQQQQQQQQHLTHQQLSEGVGNIEQQRMSHTASQSSPHHSGGMPVSGPSSSSRMHGHRSSTLRSVTPPPSRHGGYPPPSTSSNAPQSDRPPYSGSYQDYPPSSSSRNPFQPHPSHVGPGPHAGHGGHSSHMNEGHANRGRGYSNHTLGADRGGSAEVGSSLTVGGGEASSSTAGGRHSQRMIPMVTELLEQLTQTYEKELHEKEQDLLDARNLLHSIQTEIQEGHRTVEELQGKTVQLSQAEEQMRTLEGMIRQEIHLRQRLRLESMVAQEESRLREEMEVEKRRREQQHQQQFGGASDAVDMERVLALEREAEELRRSLGQLQQSRKDQVEQMVQLKSQQGKRHQEYKRLIALCCNVSTDEVDGLLGPLLSTLGSEDGVA